MGGHAFSTASILPSCGRQILWGSGENAAESDNTLGRGLASLSTPEHDVNLVILATAMEQTLLFDEWMPSGKVPGKRAKYTSRAW